MRVLEYGSQAVILSETRMFITMLTKVHHIVSSAVLNSVNTFILLVLSNLFNWSFIQLCVSKITKKTYRNIIQKIYRLFKLPVTLFKAYP